MSHVTTIDLELSDLDCLDKAAKELGLELVMNQHTFKWFGTHVGDYPLPAGFGKQDMGKCDHALRIPGNEKAYEIGVAKRKDGKPGYTLLWDFWAGGYGMQEKVGKDGEKLIQQYTFHRAKKELKKQGYRVMQTISTDGTVHVRAF